MLRRILGQRGERHAENHLKRQGLRPLARNWHCRHGELDLVMADRDWVVFVEVRLRAATRFADGIDSIDQAKRRRLVRAAAHFLARHADLAERPCRFDVVAIDGPDQRLTWTRHAFELE